MLDANLTNQLRTHLSKLQVPVELVASLGQDQRSTQLAELLTQISQLSDLITLNLDGHDQRRPSFTIARPGTDISVRFAGVPLGHEFTSLVLALLQVGGHPSTVDAALLERIRAIPGTHRFETYYSITCQNCPDVVQALNLMSIVNPAIQHVAIDGAAFAEEVEARKVLAVPAVFVDGEPFGQGRMDLEEIVDRLSPANPAEEAAELAARDTYDVLVVGGGPAGAAAGIYAARKGIRTAVVAERFGGQVLDTMAIENFVSVTHTEGPRLVAALEEHVKSYDVEILARQMATRLIPADEPGGPIGVELASGAQLSARSVVISTGARWRTMGVPGEDEYRNKGVTYCPHCDGPLFKGKAVAVIGGGNSGVEAAIDLAGVVRHVTLLEFDDRLRADDVLRRKLESLPNVEVITSALTTEVVGDGQQVTGLTYQDRTTADTRTIVLDGVFVQIGLLPNTEWLEGAVALTPRGEVITDPSGRTSVPGVFAAGDCTDVPFKQIVIALGSGATAALGAFDHLIRTSTPDLVTT